MSGAAIFQGSSIDGNRISVTLRIDGQSYTVWSTVHDHTTAPEYLLWNALEGPSDEFSEGQAKRAAKRWASQNLGRVQEMINSAQHNRTIDPGPRRNKLWLWAVRQHARATTIDLFIARPRVSLLIGLVLAVVGYLVAHRAGVDPFWAGLTGVVIGAGGRPAAHLLLEGVRRILAKVWKAAERQANVV